MVVMYRRFGGAALAGGCGALAITCLACGRYRFEVHDDGGADVSEVGDAPNDSGPPCDLGAPFGAPVLIASLSDQAADDGTLRLLPDELTGYYWSRRGGTAQIYFVERPDRASPFTVTLVSGVEGGTNQLDPAPSADGSVLVLRHSGPGDQLFVATRVTPDAFTGTTAIAELDSASTESQGFLPIGRDEIYFQSTRSGGGDIYTATRTGTSFGAPSLLTSLATASDEGDPVVTPDGLTIYFRSDRPAALGGYNIYTATRPDLGDTFGPATLVPNVNTPAEEGPSWISLDGCRLYISSAVAGTNDVYVSTRG